MNDLISRQAAIDALVTAIRKDPYYDSNEAINGLGVCDVRVILNDLPSAQPEVNCSEIPNNSDTISRQAAIDALKGLEFCHYMEFGEYIGEDTREVRLIRAEKAQDALQNLPSAQPEQKRMVRKNERL